MLDEQKAKEYSVRPNHTLGHLDCPACEDARRSVMLNEDFSSLPLRKAAPLWLESRKVYISDRSFSNYSYYMQGLIREFGDLPLGQFHIGHFREYQTKRQQPREEMTRMRGGKKLLRTWKASASCINHELNMLAQILKRAGIWKHIRDYYEPLPLPKWTPPRVLSEEEEERLFRIAAMNPEWAVAYWASSLSVNTAAAGKEIRNLRIANIKLESYPGAPMGVLFIPSDAVKNEYRARAVPMNEHALAKIHRLLERFFLICERQGIQPNNSHFLIPYMVRRGVYDPTRPTTGWRGSWRRLRAAAGFPALRSYDLRHQAITKMLENPEISEETVKSIAGHVSDRILEHYSHIRLDAKARALGAIAPRQIVGSVSGKLMSVQNAHKLRNLG